MDYEQIQSIALSAVKAEFQDALSRITDSGVRERATTAVKNYAQCVMTLYRAQTDVEKVIAQRDVNQAYSALQAYKAILSLEAVSMTSRVAGQILGTIAKALINAAI